MDAVAPFTFPAHMQPETAEQILAAAYSEIPEGKLLRRTFKELRKAGIDPPLDVEYTAEPHVHEYEKQLGVELNADILVFEEFDDMDACADAFERVLGEELVKRLDRKVRVWLRRNRPPVDEPH